MICRPKYFTATDRPKTSIFISPTFTNLHLGLFSRLVEEMIFVLSGCSSNPHSWVSIWITRSISQSWFRDRPVRRTSSAKRKFVRRVSSESPNCIPYFFVRNLCFAFDMTLSNRALKRSELSGSPCFVPRKMWNVLLRTSVFTWAVWSAYKFRKTFI